VRARLRCSKPRRHSLGLSAPLRWERRRSALSRAAPKRRCCISSPRWRAPHHRATPLPAARAQGTSRAKGLRLKLPIPHDFQDESWLRTLTVKLSGRPEAPDQAPWAHTVFSARGAITQAVHGPLQRLLGAIIDVLCYTACRQRVQSHLERRSLARQLANDRLKLPANVSVWRSSPRDTARAKEWDSSTSG